MSLSDARNASRRWDQPKDYVTLEALWWSRNLIDNRYLAQSQDICQGGTPQTLLLPFRPRSVVSLRPAIHIKHYITLLTIQLEARYAWSLQARPVVSSHNRLMDPGLRYIAHIPPLCRPNPQESPHTQSHSRYTGFIGAHIIDLLLECRIGSCGCEIRIQGQGFHRNAVEFQAFIARA